ncbi:MAG: ABC transporter permease [Dehalococcoidia bacterium]
MRRYALRRLAFFIPVMIATSALTFFAVNIVPGDPAVIVLGQQAERTQLERFREVNGLNDPIFERYLSWGAGMLTGDPGRSLFGGNIQAELKARFPVTALIVLFAFGFTIFFGVLFGLLSAVYQDGPMDYFVRTFSVFGQSVPDFYTLTLLLIVPAILWRYSPPFGYIPFWDDPLRAAQQIIPPTLILSIGGASILMRVTRSALLEVLRQDYIRTARAKGVRERVVLQRHALKNAVIPVLTIAGALIAALLGGSIILENITSLPGLGQYTFQAVVQSDLNVVMAMTMYAALLVLATNLVVDLLYGVVDPRIRYQ